MSRFVFFVMVTGLFWGCDNHTRAVGNIELSNDAYYAEEPEVDGNFEEVSLEDNMSSMMLAGAENIGEFYDHRLVFYRIDNPALRIGQSRVKELVFYFIDSSLVKLRYKTKDNVSNDLLDSLGLSKFKALDYYSMNQVEENNIVKVVNGGYKINDLLRNYELVWYKEDNVSKYRVSTDEDTVSTHYFYHEIEDYSAQLKALDRQYKELEKDIIIE